MKKVISILLFLLTFGGGVNANTPMMMHVCFNYIFFKKTIQYVNPRLQSWGISVS